MRLFVYMFLISSLVISLMSCSNSSSGTGAPPPHAEMLLSFVDEQGNDRLDPDHSIPLSESNLDIYYLKDGEKEKVFDGNLDYPKNFKIYYSEGEGKFTMMLWPSNHIEEDGNTTTLIEFPDATVDTVTMEPTNEDANSAVKIWYDDQLVWDRNSDNAMPIEITKPLQEN